MIQAEDRVAEIVCGDRENQPPRPMWQTVVVASIAAGIQFGWALQLSLLTPYVQLLGIPHQFASFIWLCGPVSGLLVQPIVGYYSDRCTSKWGRRRPFIAAGAGLVAVAIILIGFAADIGHKAGDRLGKDRSKPRAIVVFVAGFWLLDVANNMLQGPCRALLADLSHSDNKRIRLGNSFYSGFMALGNILGYSAGSYTRIYKILSFTKTEACDTYCANLKTCFFISIALLLLVTVLALATVREDQAVGRQEKNKHGRCCMLFPELFTAFKNLSRSMWILLLVTCLNWIGWFPFLLFDTDWMGKEVWGGSPSGDGMDAYNRGVSVGAFGLMINSGALLITSLLVEPLGRLVGGAKRLWGGANILLAAGLGLTALVTHQAVSYRKSHDHMLVGAEVGALIIFGFLGIPLAVTFSVPCALASIFSKDSGAGQGLSLAVLNLSIVIPQMFVSLLSGPFDRAFGGGNLPAFIAGAIAAFASGFVAFLIPSPSPDVELD